MLIHSDQQQDIMTMTRQDINNERSRQLQDITDKTSKKDQRQPKKDQRQSKTIKDNQRKINVHVNTC